MAYSPVAFLKEAYEELKKVTWPTRPDVRRLTIAVLAISVIVGAFLGLIDLVLRRVIAIIIG